MNSEKSTTDWKDLLHPNKNENLVIVEVIILGILAYYDFLIPFPANKSLREFLIVLLIVYVVGFVAFHIIEKKRLSTSSFQNRFYVYAQSMLSFFFGIFLTSIYLALHSQELIIYIICVIPLSFLLLIGLVQTLSLYQVGRFLKWVLKDEIWQRLDEQTRKDFKIAEASVRADNVTNAIVNMSKGLERELKLAIFQPFKVEVNRKQPKVDYFKILKPFESDEDSEARQRTFYNFKSYLEDQRHLTLGNIPFFLLNLTDKKISEHIILFQKFSEFLKERFQDYYQKVIEIAKILFKHDYFTIPGIKLSDLRNEAAHPQNIDGDNGKRSDRSNEILSIDNYITFIKVLAVKPNLLKLIVDLKQ